MKSISLIALAACACLVQPLTGRSQMRNSVATKAYISEISVYTAEVDNFIKKNPKGRIFGDVSSAITDRVDSWREFESEAEREKAGTGENLNQNASIWSREGKIVGANFMFTSPSGDWAHIIMYYFLEDGTLARVQAQLNTFYGEISVVRDRYYDRNGKLLKSTRKFLDLNTQKPKKPGEFIDNPIPVYRTVAELPFRKLL